MTKGAVLTQTSYESAARRHIVSPLLGGELRTALARGVDHGTVLARIREESGWTPRYAFMVAMSAGIAVLGLLLSSPAVVIGAMLISPLMNPILGLGFSLTLFDFAEMRRSLIALATGSLSAVLFTALIVLLSPLKATTPEILARTRPNLFDLLVALFAALAGTFAIIRGRGETITGVAIATALMPPLAVVGYGLATWNLPVLTGSFALFATNFVTIALSAMIMARLYGFGHALSSHQGWLQTVLLVLVFVAMAIPLGISLTRIAREALITSEARTALNAQFGPRARVTQLAIDFDAKPITIRAVVIAPRSASIPVGKVTKLLQNRLDRKLALQLDQVLLAPGASALDAQRTELQKAKDDAAARQEGDRVSRIVGLAAGVDPDLVTIDRAHRRAQAAATSLAGADLATYKALEDRAAAATDGWEVWIVPPFQPLPQVEFADGDDQLSDAARNAVSLAAWAVRRWNVPGVGVPGLPSAPSSGRPLLPERRARAVADLLLADGVSVRAAPAAGRTLRLVIGQ